MKTTILGIGNSLLRDEGVGVEALKELSLPAASTAIHRRVAHRNAILQGRSVLQMGSRGAPAADEIRQLIDELKTHMEN